MMTQITVDIRELDERHVVVAVCGEIDMATAPILVRALRWYAEFDITVDLSAVPFLGSSGLTGLIQAQKRLLQTGRALRTTGESDIILAAMRIVGLEDTFHPPTGTNSSVLTPHRHEMTDDR